MKDRNRIVYLILILTVGVSVVVAITVFVLYEASLDQQRERLSETAQSRARMIEALADHETEFAHVTEASRSHGTPFSATINLIRQSHSHFQGFGKTGEFTLARREGEKIVFLLRHRHKNLKKPEPLPFSSPLAEPMRRALNGQSGIMIGQDYRGETVLAAHEPVKFLNLGIVAKIDMSEIRKPFLYASLYAIAFAALLVTLGTALIIRVGNPLVEGLQKYAHVLEKEIVERKRAESDLTWELSVNKVLAELSKTLIAPETDIQVIAQTVLDQAKALTNSAQGLIAFKNPETGAMISHTPTNIIGEQSHLTEEEEESVIQEASADERYSSLWRQALAARQPMFTNTPHKYETSDDPPKGHIPLLKFLTTPALIGDVLAGQIAVANADREYTERDLKAVGRLADLYAAAIMQHRAEQKIRQNEEELKNLAYYDTLTGLPNRQLFEEHLQQAILQLERRPGKIAVLFLDLDNFKNINDSLGHNVGDEILLQVANRLQSAIRSTDMISRLGGDEYTLLLTNLSESDSLVKIAQDILRHFSRPFDVDGKAINVTASIGVAICPDDSTDKHDLVKFADIAMYRAKDQGKDKFHFYSTEINN